MGPNIIGRLEALEHQGVDVGLVCARRWPEGGAMIDSTQIQASIPIFPLATANTGRGPYYLYLPGISGIVRRFDPDLIHVREEMYTVAGAQFLGERALRFSSIPFVFESWQNIRKKYPVPSRWFEAWGYRAARGAVAGAPSVVPVLQQGGFKGSIEMIPLGGFDPRVFFPGPPLPRNTPSIAGYIGRLSTEKGIDLMIKAAASSGVGMRLIFAGDGPAMGEARRLAVDHKVDAEFLGPVPQSEIPGLLRSLDVLVLPSRTTPRWREQWGRVLTEAMASGTPVIGSSSGEIPHVIGDAGMVFPEGSVEDLSKALKFVLGSADEANRLSELGLERAASYTWERHAARTKSFYERMGE